MSSRLSLFWEISRKIIHLSGLFIVLFYNFLLINFSNRVAILVLTAVLLLLLEIEYIRLEHKPRVVGLFEGFLRKHEKNQLTGAVFYVISSIICFSAFDYWIAVLAMFMLVFGDIFASLMGKTFGRRRLFRKKTWIGTLSGLAANLLVGILLLPEFSGLVAIVALVASVVELLTNKLDDNLTVPLFAGFVGQIYVYLFDLQLPIIQFPNFGFF